MAQYGAYTAFNEGGAAPLICCADVTIVPVTRVHRHVSNGGPDWPGFDAQTGLRHCRNGLPVDERPDLAAQSAIKLDGDAVWGGFLDSHFGHFMAEHFPRLPQSVQARPRDKFLFTVDPGLGNCPLPEWMWDVLAWVGLNRDQVHLVREPVRVARLWAGVQAEMLPNLAPDPEYLDLLDGLAQNCPIEPVEMVYVSRANLPHQGGGGTAGESYVEGQLRRLGVSVLDPGATAIGQQISVYRGAKHLVFAEGSALHGRQLLGRVPQRISVLRRRRGRSMAANMLTPRVSKLTYHDVTAHALVPQWKNGQPRPDPALALYDLPALLAVFARLGHDLAADWEPDAFRAAAQKDIAGWLGHHPPTASLRATYDEAIAASGLAAQQPLTHPRLV